MNSDELKENVTRNNGASGRNTHSFSARQPKIIAMMRIKNEEEWLLPTLEKASQLVDAFVILDDGSTDGTPDICRAFPKVVRYEFQNEQVTDEARDKDRLLQWTLDENPDWILALDGDELLEDAAPIIIRNELAAAPPTATAFTFNFLYMWDRHDRYRVDGNYSNLRHPRLFRVSGLNIDLRVLRFARTGNGGNFHCGSVPRNLPGQLHHLDVNVKHYGYFERSQRERKLAFYARLDPANAATGNYRHLVDEQGMQLMPWRERDPSEAAYLFGGDPLHGVTEQAAGEPLIAIVYGHSPMTVGRMFKAALRQMGARHVSIGGFVGNRVGWPISRTYDEEIDVPDIIIKLEKFYQASHIVSLVESRCGVRPAIILQIDGDTHVCNDLGFKDILFVTVATDPHLPSETNGHASGCSDYFYSMQSSYMPRFGDKTLYMPYGYDPEIHFREPNMEKKYDVSCIGFQFPERAEFGRRLREMGLNVRFENGPILDEYRRILNESWICFNLSAADDMNMRVFETMACGTLLVSNITTDMAGFFREGVDYVAYRSLEEAVEKITYYLGHKDELAAIAESGHRAVQGHTYADRLRRIFSDIGLGDPATGAERGETDETVRPIEQLPSYYRHVRPEILSAVPEDAKSVLDVGCGAGMLGKALKSRDPDRKVTGIEMNREAGRYAAMHLDEVFQADLESFIPPFEANQFDCVIFADVLEHLKEPWRVARLYASFLKPGGTFISSIPNIRYLPFLRNLVNEGAWEYREEGLLDNTHLRFFTRREFFRVMDYAGIHCDSLAYLGGNDLGEYRPKGNERVVEYGGISLKGVPDEDFAEMRAFQLLFTGTFQPGKHLEETPLPRGRETESDFTRYRTWLRQGDSLYEKSIQLVGENRYRDAILLLKLLLKSRPNHTRALNDLALLYYQIEETELALKTFERLVTLSPANTHVMKNLANLYYDLNDTAKALDLFSRVAAINPGDAEALISLGNLHYLHGRRDDARNCFRLVLETCPDNQIALKNLELLGAA